jgi:hypothetical protein
MPRKCRKVIWFVLTMVGGLALVGMAVVIVHLLFGGAHG